MYRNCEGYADPTVGRAFARIKWAKPLLLYMKMVCAHIIGTDHFLFNVAGVVIFFYIVLITIEPV